MLLRITSLCQAGVFMKALYLVVFSLMSFAVLSANPISGMSEFRKYHYLQPIKPQSAAKADSATGFDVQKYTISLSISQQSQYISGNVLAEVLATQELASISYNLEELTVTEVLVNGELAEYTHEDGLLEIDVDVSAQETFTTQVFYSGNPQLSGDIYNIGMYILSSSIYTISDPDAARYWWPCYDHPWDKAIVDLIITLRSDWMVAANGIRESITNNGDGTATTIWRGQYPMTTYLVCITASDYVELSQTALDGELPILNFVRASQYNLAQYDLATLPLMIDYFSTLFGAYPFEKYGNATAPISTFAAMEHQTMTTLGNYIINGSGTYVLVIAHELAHQWFGNAVSFLDFADVWLSEGFATYCEQLWVDKLYGWQEAANYVANEFHQYYLNWESTSNPATIYDPEFNYYFYPSSYEKAASVLHMLRLKLGDPQFFQLLQEYFATYKYGNAITAEFQALAEDISGQDLQQFFDQWIYGRGIPTVNYSLWHHPENNQLKIIAQSISPTATDFDLDLPFIVYQDADSDSLLVRATPSGYNNLYSNISMPTDYTANLNNWVLLRGLNESRPQLSACLPSSSSVSLFWDELPGAAGYQVLRRSDPTSAWQILNDTPILGTEWVDDGVSNFQSYEYCIKALDEEGFYSMRSNSLSATPVAFSFANHLLVVDETRNGNGMPIAPDDAMVDDYYAAALSPLEYDEWDVETDGMPDLQLLGSYKVVLWHDDDLSTNLIYSAQDLLSGYMIGGGQLLVSGWKTASALNEEFFARLVPNLISYFDYAPTLLSAYSDVYPELIVDESKLIDIWHGMLPYLYSFAGDFESLYMGNVASGSEAENHCLAFWADNLVFLGFPLYFMEPAGVRDFLQEMIPQLASVDNEDLVNIPPNLKLSSYPNPFNPTTSISFELPASGFVNLRLYNLKGQKMNELISGYYPAGIHTISLDAGNYASGIYILSLNSQGQTINRRLTLMK